MFTLNLTLSRFPICALGQELKDRLVEVPDTDRRTAMAHAFGFSETAELHQALAMVSLASREGSGRAFNECLARLGHDIPPQAFDEALGLVLLRNVARDHQDLTYAGMGQNGRFRYDKSRMLVFADEQAEFQAQRFRLLDSKKVSEFLRSLAFLQSAVPTRRNPLPTDSYALKHLAEKFLYTSPDGTQTGNGYVSNGMLIAAGIHANVPWKHDPGEPNVQFNMKAFLGR